MFIDGSAIRRMVIFSALAMVLAGCSSLDAFDDEDGTQAVKTTRLSSKKAILLPPGTTGGPELKLYIMSGS
jgi:hypothetical protein